MPLSNEQAQALKESIDKLTQAVNTVALRLEALITKLGTVAGAIMSSADSKKK